MKCFEKIIKWWNKLPYCEKKRMEWLCNRYKSLNEIHWPDNVVHDHLEDFKESDWCYDTGSRCERYVTWFFHVFTRRCTVLERTPLYNDGETPGFESHHPTWRTAYRVHEDSGDDLKFIEQQYLSL